jgi:glycosyltransferase involved in cell wall biosynthesis
VESLLDALARTEDSIRIAFVGNGFDASHEDQARRRGVAGRVSFLPAVPPSQVVPFVADADVAGVLYRPSNPSVRQCLPNGLFQALAAGLPVVYADDLPMVAAEVDGAGIAVDADDPAAIASSFDRLARDRMMRAKLSECASMRARESSWEHEERRLGDILDRVLGTAEDA